MSNADNVLKQLKKGRGLSYAFMRTNDKPLDISGTFQSLADATCYALNNDPGQEYCPYAGQIISVVETNKLYFLKETTIKEGDSDNGNKHFSLEEVVGGTAINEGFLYANKDDTNNGHTLEVGELVIEKGKNHTDEGQGTRPSTGNLTVGGNANIENNIVVNGNAEFKGNVTISGADKDTLINGNLTVHGELNTDNLKTPNMVVDYIKGSGEAPETGSWSLGKDPDGGTNAPSQLIVDNILVRQKITATTVEVSEAYYVGGMMILTVGMGFDCTAVEDTEAGYKCYFNTTTTNDKKVKNLMRVGDNALCQTFNIEIGNRFYWRRVVEIGENYVILSKTECAENSDAPMAGDVIVHCGNISSTSGRDGVTLISSVVSGATPQPPSFMQFEHINDFAWPQAGTVISPTGNKFTGDFMAKDEDGTAHNLLQLSNTMQENLNELTARQDNAFQMHLLDFGYVADNWATDAASSKIEPEVNWSDTDKADHVGDFAVTKDGRCLKFMHDSSGYYWRLVEDEYLTQALTMVVAAQSRIDEFASDQVITTLEKEELNRTWNGIKTEWKTLEEIIIRNDYDATAGADYVSLHSIAKTSYDALNNLMEGILKHLEEDTQLTEGTLTVNGVAYNFKNVWSTYYSNYESLRVSTDNQTRIKIANAQTDADTANSALTNIADDSKITTYEHSQLKDAWDSMNAQYDAAKADADKYSVNVTDLTTAHTTLKTIIEGVLALETDYTITEDYTNAWNNFFTKLKAARASIVTEAKKLADDAQSAADAAASAASSAAELASAASSAASTANTALTKIAKDGEIDRDEYMQMKALYQTALQNYESARYEWTTYELSATNTLYTTLNAKKAALDGLMGSSGTITAFFAVADNKIMKSTDGYDSSTCSTVWNEFYTALSALITTLNSTKSDVHTRVKTTYNAFTNSDGELDLEGETRTWLEGALAEERGYSITGSEDGLKLSATYKDLSGEQTKTVSADLKLSVDSEGKSHIVMDANDISFGTYSDGSDIGSLTSLFTIDDDNDIVKFGGFEVKNNQLGATTSYNQSSAATGFVVNISPTGGLLTTYKSGGTWQAVRVDASNNEGVFVHKSGTRYGTTYNYGVYSNVSYDNNSQYDYAMYGSGNSYFGGHANTDETVEINGLRMNATTASSSRTLLLSEDFVIVTGQNVTLTLPSPSDTKSRGKVYYIKGNGGTSLSGSNIMMPDSNDTRSEADISSKSHMVVCSGGYWVLFYCG